MTALTLARLQFAITIAFHFLFVPLSIGLSLLVAVMHTLYQRTGDEKYKRMTKFWGKLFLITFAMGVVTGIVQEFQFGMNWSAYSRFVGDVFGPTLAIEGLLAFFLESTFLGLWIFGWNRLPGRIHVATIWIVAIGTQISAWFILAANSWMQHPVGYTMNPRTGRAEMTDFVAMMTNSTLIVAFVHTVLAAILTGGMFVLGVSAYHLLRKHDTDVFVRSAGIALVAAFIGASGVVFTGHAQSQVMTEQQPMKMAAAEALWSTERGASFSLLTIGDPAGARPVFQIRVPNLLSVLATNSWNGTVEGMNDIQAAYETRYGPGNYMPIPWVTYWSFRIMVGLGFLLVALTGFGLVQMRRGKFTSSRRYLRLVALSVLVPTIANIAGWVFTEVGRQPWVVFGLMRTSDAVSPSVGRGTIATTLVGFTLVYGLLSVVEIGMLVRFAKAGIKPEPEPASDGRPKLVY
ncbi:MAG: cytochrome ubiquinol oxidase subunit I [Actinomycetota bacterium]